MKIKLSFRAASLLFGLTALAVSAHADVKTVSQVTVTGGGANAPASPMTVTTYYQGARARVELPNGFVTIYDGDADKVYRVDTIKKSFTVMSYKDAIDGETYYQPGVTVVHPKLDTTLDLTQTEPTDADVQTVAGLQARKYLVTGTAKPPSSGARGGRGGRRHGFGGGGFPGGFPLQFQGGYGGGGYGGGGYGGGGYGRGDGNGGYGNDAGGGRRGAITSIDGEVWLSDTLKLPADKKASLFPSVSMLAWSATSLFKPLTEKLGKGGAIPLKSRIQVSKVRPGVNDLDTNTGPEPVVTTTEVTAVSLDPLDPALFRVPSDDAQVTSAEQQTNDGDTD